MTSSSTIRPGIFDGHNDLMFQMRYSDEGGEWFSDGRKGGHIDLPRLRSSAFTGGLFAMFVRHPHWSPEHRTMHPKATGGYSIVEQPAVPQSYARSEVIAQFAAFLRILARHSPDLQLVRQATDLDTAEQAERIAVVLHIEGAEAIGKDLAELELFHAAGLRSLGIVWSRPNQFAEGVPFEFPCRPDTGSGLTSDGARLVARCEELGVMVDLAHINERGFWDVAEIARRPLVVSHSAAHALSPSSRNLTDEQIDCIGESGGMIGVNLSVRDLRADGARDADTPLENVVRHIEYIGDRIGLDHVGLGSDLDGALIPSAVGDVTGLEKIASCLQDRGCDVATVDKVMRSNWHRTLAVAWS